MKKFALLFDMDGVIIDSNPAHKVMIQEFCKKYNKVMSDEDMRKHIYGRTNKEWIRHLFGEDLSDAQLKKYADEKELMFRVHYKKDIKPLPGLIDFLKMLEANNIPKAVGTSAPPANVQFVFENMDIQKYFGAVLDEDSVTVGKPNPEIYLKAANALNMAPADCIVVEDSLAGVEAGKRARCKVIGITTTHTPEELHKADITVADFTTLTLTDLEKLFQ